MVRSAPRPVPHRRLARTRALARRANRRRANWPRRILLSLVTLLALECAAVALYSPRLYVRRVQIQSSPTIPASLVRAQFDPGAHQNLFLAPTDHWRRQIERIPSVSRVSIEKHLPGTVKVLVEERTPWATVRTREGRWHTIDSGFVPFRSSSKPEPNLPRILVSDIAAWEAIPGMPLPSSGLPVAQQCYRWSQAHLSFPLTQIEIDQASKVCLNRAGGVSVRLGTGEGIYQKLVALEKLIAERPDLTYSTSIAYVNLYAADAPAIGLVAPKTTDTKRKETPEKPH